MSIKAFPLNQQEYSYNAQDVMKYYAGRNSGVFETGENLKVSANGGLEIRVNSGMGWLSRDYVASVAFWNDSVEYLMVDAGHDTYDRVDLVVVSWNFIQQEQNPRLVIRKGTPASSPAVPLLVNNSSTIEIALARINVGKGDIELHDANIVDLRGNDTYCPMVYDEQTIREAFRKCVGYADGVNKISDFPSVTPASSDKILIEQGGEGKSASLADLPIPTKVQSALDKKIAIPYLLWENANPTSSFEPQTLSNINLSEYKEIEIWHSFINNINDNVAIQRFKNHTINNYLCILFLNKDHTTSVTDFLNACSRKFSITEDGITFEEGNMIYSGGVYAGINGRCVPLKIYGIK